MPLYEEEAERDAVYCDICGNHHWPRCDDFDQQTLMEEELLQTKKHQREAYKERILTEDADD
jgi:hypothetical protein